MFCLLFVAFQNTVGNFYSQSIAVTINHVTSADGGFNSSLVIDNIDEYDGSYLVSLKAENGSLMGLPIELSVPANSIRKFENILNGAHFARVVPVSFLGHDEEIITPKANIFTTYSHQSGLGSEAIVKAQSHSELATKFRFFPGNWQSHFDGIAVVAHDYTPTTILVKQIHADTNEILHEELIAENMVGKPFETKALALLGGPNGSSFNLDEGSYFEITSTGLIGLTALRGNIPGSTEANLWETSVSIVEVPDPEIELFEGVVTDDGLVKISFKGKHFVAWDVEFSTDLIESPGISSYIPEIIDGTVSVQLIGFETDANFKLCVEGANGAILCTDEITVPYN